MNKKLSRLGIGTMTAVLTSIVAAAPAYAYVQPIWLEVNQSYYMPQNSRITRVAVTNPKIADINVINKNAINIIALSPGSTSLTVWNANGMRQEFMVNVSSADSGTAKMIEKAIALPNVTVQKVGDRILLRGTVQNQYEKDLAYRIASLFVSQAQEKKKTRAINMNANGSTGVSNSVESEEVGTDSSEQVINLLEMANPDQINIEAMVLEIRTSDAEQLGEQYASLDPTQSSDAGITSTHTITHSNTGSSNRNSSSGSSWTGTNGNSSSTSNTSTNTNSSSATTSNSHNNSSSDSTTSTYNNKNNASHSINNTYTNDTSKSPNRKNVYTDTSEWGSSSDNSYNHTNSHTSTSTNNRSRNSSQSSDTTKSVNNGTSSSNTYTGNNSSTNSNTQGGEDSDTYTYVNTHSNNNVHLGSIGQFFFGETYGPQRSKGSHWYSRNWLFTHFSQINVQLQALVSSGRARVISRPNVTTMSGRTASILVGGEIPYPTKTGDSSNVSIEYKPYGIQLDLLQPKVDQYGNITSELQASVSSLDWSNAVTANGFKMPGLSTKKAVTTVNIPSGMTMVIGGLLNSEDSKSTSKVPILGDIPLLGELFKSHDNSHEDTEIMILITPRVVNETDTVTMGPTMSQAYEEIQNSDQLRKKVNLNELPKKKEKKDQKAAKSVKPAARKVEKTAVNPIKAKPMKAVKKTDRPVIWTADDVQGM